MPPVAVSGLFAALSGACVGSFLATWRLRRGRGEDWIRGRSRCDLCGAALGPVDLLPLFGWLLRRGCCRSCGGRIDPRHPLTEATAAAGCALAFLLLPPGPALVVVLLGFLLLALALVDLDELRLPDVAVAAVAIFALLLLLLREAGLPAGFLPSFGGALAGALGAAGGLLLLREAYRRLRGREGLGAGDVKLAGAAGLWLGAAALPLFFLLAGILGLVLAGLRGAWRRPDRPVPFGPALASALWILLLHAARGG